MRNRLQLAVTGLLLAAQATTAFPGMVAASATSATTAGVPSKLEVSINTNKPNPIVVADAQPQPDFDTDVLTPLRAKQAAEAQATAQAAAAAQAAAQAAAAAKAAQAAALARQKAAQVQTASIVIPSGDVWGQLRACESGGNYARNSGNGYYGAYQFDIGTWNDYDGYARPDLAPPAVQDAKAQATQAARGWSPWPACARKLGLL